MKRFESKIMANNRRMKAARVMRGVTQMQPAEQLGMKENEISRIETGRTQPGRDLKERIAKTLGKPAFELFAC